MKRTTKYTASSEWFTGQMTTTGLCYTPICRKIIRMQTPLRHYRPKHIDFYSRKL